MRDLQMIFATGYKKSERTRSMLTLIEGGQSCLCLVVNRTTQVTGDMDVLHHFLTFRML